MGSGTETLEEHTTTLAEMAQMNTATKDPVSITMTFNITWTVTVTDPEGAVICAGEESNTLPQAVLSAILDWKHQYRH